jgi:magnesium transporter
MTVAYRDEEADKLREYLGDDLFVRQRALRHVCIPVGDNAYFLAFYWCDIRDTEQEEKRIAVFCRENDLVFVGDSTHGKELLDKMAKYNNSFSALAEFLFELTSGDLDELESIENDINELERRIITTESTIKGASSRIIDFRRALLRIKRYYESLGIVAERLSENENNAISADTLTRFAALGRRIQYLTKSVTDMREYVTQVREAYQASIDIEQNQIMKVFTVLTAIFLPLTLIVGWYGMNFQIPEFSWRFGYIYVAILSAVVCTLCFFIFKRRNWF